MRNIPEVFITKGKERSAERGHPWIFSGALQQPLPDLLPGDLVKVMNFRGKCLGMGHYQPEASIAVRLVSFKEETMDDTFWKQKILSAWQHRLQVGLCSATTNAFRLIHAEGDGMPGLIADYYAGTVVLQAHSEGMYRLRGKLATLIPEALGDKVSAVYDKSLVGKEKNSELLWGHPPTEIVQEYGYRFKIDWKGGQKTGFFLDQRENRKLLESFARGKKVLNTFAYSGGFSVYALGAGAELVHSVDVSEKAIALANENVHLNGLESKHQAWAMDVFDFFKQQEKYTYNLMVLDPPAFAKSTRARHKAVMGYKNLNTKAMQLISPGGIIFTFSCSQVVDEALFYHTITAAAIEAGRQVQVLQRLSQPADHPVSIYHTEGAYLKGLVLRIT